MSKASESLEELLEHFEVIDTSHLYHHEHDADKLKQLIAQAVEEIIGEPEDGVFVNELYQAQMKRLAIWLGKKDV